jgi:hypothetical protein
MPDANLKSAVLPSTKLAFTIDEWGAATGQSRSFIYEEMRAGRLRAKKAGRRTIITREFGLEYLASLPDYHPQTKVA